MKPLPRILIWLVLLGLMFGALWLAHGEPQSQGDGASALIRGAKDSRTTSDGYTPAGLPPKPLEYHFTATATDYFGLGSDHSSQISFTNSAMIEQVTLAWDWYGPQIITNFTVFKWREGRRTNSFNAGTNFILTVRLIPIALTNIVVTVTGSNADNLAYSPGLVGPWIWLGTNYWRATNPPAQRYWRAVGPASGGVGKVFIQKENL